MDYGAEDILLVADLVKHCVNLRQVDVYNLNPIIVGMLVTLGSRIPGLSIMDESVSDNDPLRDMFRACTNLEAVELNLPNSVPVTNVLCLVRTKLVWLTLYQTDLEDNLLLTKIDFSLFIRLVRY